VEAQEGVRAWGPKLQFQEKRQSKELGGSFITEQISHSTDVQSSGKVMLYKLFLVGCEI
jgi:hypothetical protein